MLLLDNTQLFAHLFGLHLVDGSKVFLIRCHSSLVFFKVGHCARQGWQLYSIVSLAFQVSMGSLLLGGRPFFLQEKLVGDRVKGCLHLPRDLVALINAFVGLGC